MTWASPKNKGDIASYQDMDKIMKYKFEHFVEVFIHYYGGFKVLKFSLVASSSILACLQLFSYPIML
jgi:hypothetical protein